MVSFLSLALVLNQSCVVSLNIGNSDFNCDSLVENQILYKYMLFKTFFIPPSIRKGGYIENPMHGSCMAAVYMGTSHPNSSLWNIYLNIMPDAAFCALSITLSNTQINSTL
jgi:hypothetical protein